MSASNSQQILEKTEPVRGVKHMKPPLKPKPLVPPRPKEIPYSSGASNSPLLSPTCGPCSPTLDMPSAFKISQLTGPQPYGTRRTSLKRWSSSVGEEANPENNALSPVENRSLDLPAKVTAQPLSAPLKPLQSGPVWKGKSPFMLTTRGWGEQRLSQSRDHGNESEAASQKPRPISMSKDTDRQKIEDNALEQNTVPNSKSHPKITPAEKGVTLNAQNSIVSPAKLPSRVSEDVTMASGFGSSSNPTQVKEVQNQFSAPLQSEINVESSKPVPQYDHKEAKMGQPTGSKREEKVPNVPTRKSLHVPKIQPEEKNVIVYDNQIPDVSTTSDGHKLLRDDICIDQGHVENGDEKHKPETEVDHPHNPQQIGDVTPQKHTQNSNTDSEQPTPPDKPQPKDNYVDVTSKLLPPKPKERKKTSVQFNVPKSDDQAEGQRPSDYSPSETKEYRPKEDESAERWQKVAGIEEKPASHGHQKTGEVSVEEEQKSAGIYKPPSFEGTQTPNYTMTIDDGICRDDVISKVPTDYTVSHRSGRPDTPIQENIDVGQPDVPASSFHHKEIKLPDQDLHSISNTTKLYENVEHGNQDVHTKEPDDDEDQRSFHERQPEDPRVENVEYIAHFPAHRSGHGKDTDSSHDSGTPYIQHYKSSTADHSEFYENRESEDKSPPSQEVYNHSKVFHPINAQGKQQEEVTPLKNYESKSSKSKHGHVEDLELSDRSDFKDGIQNYNFSQIVEDGEKHGEAESEDHSYSRSQLEKPLHSQSKGLAHTYKPSKEPVHTYSPSEELLHTHKPSAKPVHTYSPSEEPVHTFSPSEEPVHTFSPSEEPVHTYSPSEELLPTHKPSAKPVHTYSPSEEPVHTYSPSEEPVHTYSPSEEPVHTYSPSEEPVHTYSPSEEPVHTYSPSEEPVHTYSPSEELLHTYKPSEELLHTYKPSEELLHTYKPSEELLHTYKPSEELLHTYRPSEEPVPTYSPSEEPLHTCKPSEEPGHTYSPSEELLHTHNPSEESVHTYSPSEKPAHTYSPSEELLHTYKPSEEAFHTPASSEEPVHIYASSEEPVNTHAQSEPMQRYPQSEDENHKYEVVKKARYTYDKPEKYTYKHSVEPVYQNIQSEEETHRCVGLQKARYECDQPEKLDLTNKQPDELIPHNVKSDELAHSPTPSKTTTLIYEQSEKPLYTYDQSNESYHQDVQSEVLQRVYEHAEKTKYVRPENPPENIIFNEEQSDESNNQENRAEEQASGSYLSGKNSSETPSEEPNYQPAQSEELNYLQAQSEEPNYKPLQSEEPNYLQAQFKGPHYKPAQSSDVLDYQQEQSEESHYQQERSEDSHYQQERSEDSHYQQERSEDSHYQQERSEDSHYQQPQSEELDLRYGHPGNIEFKDKSSEDSHLKYYSEQPQHKDVQAKAPEGKNKISVEKNPSLTGSTEIEYMGIHGVETDSGHVTLVGQDQAERRPEKYLEEEYSSPEECHHRDDSTSETDQRDLISKEQELGYAHQEERQTLYTHTGEPERGDSKETDRHSESHSESPVTRAEDYLGKNTYFEENINGHSELAESEYIEDRSSGPKILTHTTNEIQEESTGETVSDTEDTPEERHFDFLEGTDVLDTSLMRGRASLGKKRCHRTPATGTCTSQEETDPEYWMFRDSTEPKISPGKDSDGGEKDETSPDCTPDNSPSSAKSPTKKSGIFSGIISPSILKGRLKSRNKTPEDEATKTEPKESQDPTSPGKEKSESSSHSLNWLQALKKKKKKKPPK
ncbi:182 kDa tankyrase-1-binding protein [Rhinoderma darwinii]|uniref:182 kDa tankyrase-1-binding protein n=1 Tax=Rhinoderma darwinii TaxID=43563 RepID=UPI003F67D6B2